MNNNKKLLISTSALFALVIAPAAWAQMCPSPLPNGCSGGYDAVAVDPYCCEDPTGSPTCRSRSATRYKCPPNGGEAHGNVSGWGASNFSTCGIVEGSPYGGCY